MRAQTSEELHPATLRTRQFATFALLVALAPLISLLLSIVRFTTLAHSKAAAALTAVA